MFHATTCVAEAFPTTTRISRTSFLLHAQRYYSTTPGTKYIDLSDPIYYFCFLTKLKPTRAHDVNAEIALKGLKAPSARELKNETLKRIEKNPFGMMTAALKLRQNIPRKGGYTAGNSANSVRRRCLRELYQQARAAVGMPRDKNNAGYTTEQLWRCLNKAADEQRQRLHPEVTTEFLQRRTSNLRRSATRHLSRVKDVHRSRHARKPAWHTGGNVFTAARLERKLKSELKRSARSISTQLLRTTVASIVEHIRVKEKEHAVADATALTVAAWNVDKNSHTIRNSIGQDEVHIVPAAVDVLCVAEASQRVPAHQPRRQAPSFGRCNWTSSSVGVTQILVRHPHTLTEIDVGEFPSTASADDDDDDDEPGISDTAEITACRVKDGRSASTTGEFFIVVACYLPPSMRMPRFKAAVQYLAETCRGLAKTDNGVPVVIAGDFNVDLLEDRKPLAASKAAAWKEAWDKLPPLPDRRQLQLKLMHGTSEASFNPTNTDTKCSLLDAVYLLSESTSNAKAYPFAGSITAGPTQHAIVSGCFTLGSNATSASKGFSFQEHAVKHRIRWKSIRYDEARQDAMRIALQARLLAEDLTIANLGDVIKSVAAEHAGTVKIAVGPQKRSTVRNGTMRRRAEPWNTRSLDSAAKELTTLSRRLESNSHKIKVARAKAGFSRWKLFRLCVQLQSNQRSLRQATAAFARDVRRTKQLYYDKVNSLLRIDNTAMISEAHKTRRRVLRARSPKATIPHDAKTLNNAWQEIFKGDGKKLPNEAWLRNKRVGILAAAENEAAAHIVISPERVRQVLSQLSRNKACGLDDVANEALRLIADMDDAVIERIATMFTNIIEDPLTADGAGLDTWKQGLLAMFLKATEGPPSPTDYRPISLLSHLAKLLELVILRTIEEDSDLGSKLGRQQFGFRRGSGTIDAIFNMRAAHEVCKQRGIPLLVALLDIKKAFDTVPFDVIAASLDRLKVAPKLTRFLRYWIEGQTRRIIVEGNGEDDWLTVNRGVPQGSILSPLLFTAVMDTLDGYLKGEAVLGQPALTTPSPRLLVDGWMSQMYADDTALLGHCIDDINTLLERTKEWSEFVGLNCHPTKFELLRLGALRLKSFSGRDIRGSNNAALAPKSYRNVIADAHREPADRRYHWNDLRMIKGNVKFGNVVLPLSKTAKYLGVDVRSWSTARRGGNVTGAAFLPRTHHRLKGAKANTSATGFAFRVGVDACTVRVASALHRPIAEGIYYGVETTDLTEKCINSIRTVVGNAAKKSLGTHFSAATTSALQFLGWQEPKVAIALRRLRLLKKATTLAAPAIENMSPPTLLAVQGRDRGKRAPYMTMLRHSLVELIGPGILELHFPESGAIWKQSMVEDLRRRGGDSTHPSAEAADNDIAAAPENQVPRANIDELIKALKACDKYNHQHPIIRVSPEYAFAAFKFTCDSVIPFFRKEKDDAGTCELCGETVVTSGFHFLAECKHRECRGIMSGILTRDEVRAWDAGRESGDYSEVNDIILQDNPALAYASDSVRTLLLVNDPNNDLDVLSRLLIREFRDSTVTDGKQLWKRNEVVNRGGAVKHYYLKKSASWSSDGIKAERELLYTAYRWVGKLCHQLYRVQSENFKARTEARRRARRAGAGAAGAAGDGEVEEAGAAGDGEVVA